MRTPLIGLFCVVSLLLPGTARACLSHGDMMMILGFVGLAIAGVTVVSAAVVWEIIRAWQRSRHITLALPRFWFLRLWSLGLLAFPLTIALIAGITALSPRALGDAGIVALIVTTPLVLQTAYGARLWHRGLPRA